MIVKAAPDAEQLELWCELAFIALRVVLSVAGRIACKLLPQFIYYPLYLFRLLDSFLDPAGREREAKAFWQCPPCCKGRVGRHIFSKLRGREESEHGNSDNGWRQLLLASFLSFFRRLAAKMGLAIADVECRHALGFKVLRKGHGVKPYSVERFAFDNFLTVWRLAYMVNGGRDPRFLTRKVLEARGMYQPLPKKRRYKHGHGGNCLFFFINQKLKGTRGKSTPALRKKIKQKYWTLSREARAEWLVRWRASRGEAAQAQANTGASIINL